MVDKDSVFRLFVDVASGGGAIAWGEVRASIRAGC